MADSLPVLPDDVLLIIAREYRLATAEDRSLDGWWSVHAEMRQLPRCPKRKQVINVKGFYIPRHGNLLEPVTGYFWRRLIRSVFAKNADPRFFQWFRRVFGHDDYLRCTQPSGPTCAAFIAMRFTSVATRRRRKKGSTRKTSGPFEKRCGAWTTCGLNATG